MKKIKRNILCLILLLLAACSINIIAQEPPLWVIDKEGAYPDRDWLAVTGKGNTVMQAEDFVVSRISQQFRVDINTRMAYQEHVNERMTLSDKGNQGDFERITNHINDIFRTSSTKGIIGLIVENWTDPQTNEIHAIARMNRYECGRRYSEIIDENERVIKNLVEKANTGDPLDRVQTLNYAHNLALMTDDLHNMRTVLHSMYIHYTLEYGNANNILMKANETKKELIFYVEVTGDQNNRLLRTLTSILNKQGFKTESTRYSNYAIIVELEVEDIINPNAQFQAARFTINYALYDENDNEVFSNTFTDSNRHNTIEQARQGVMRLVEDYMNKDGFTKDFDNFINSR